MEDDLKVGQVMGLRAGQAAQAVQQVKPLEQQKRSVTETASQASQDPDDSSSGVVLSISKEAMSKARLGSPQDMVKMSFESGQASQVMEGNAGSVMTAQSTAASSQLQNRVEESKEKNMGTEEAATGVQFNNNVAAAQTQMPGAVNFDSAQVSSPYTYAQQAYQGSGTNGLLMTKMLQV